MFTQKLITFPLFASLIYVLASCVAEDPVQENDTIPDSFHIEEQKGIGLGKEAVSTTVVISGLSEASPISIIGGEYSINESAFSKEASLINNGDSLRLKLTAGFDFGGLSSAYVNVGGISSSFEVYSVKEPIVTSLSKPDSVTLLKGSKLSVEYICSACDRNRTEFRWVEANTGAVISTLEETEFPNSVTGISYTVSVTPVTKTGDKGQAESITYTIQGVKQVVSSYGAFAALNQDGSVSTWGNMSIGGDSRHISEKLKDVSMLASSFYGFAAVNADGSVETWGLSDFGGDSSKVQSELTGVESITGNRSGYAAIREDGAIIAWGDDGWYSDVNFKYYPQVGMRAVKIIPSQRSFAAILENGSLKLWGAITHDVDIKKPIANVSSVVELAGLSSRDVFCHTSVDKKAYCWGDLDRLNPEYMDLNFFAVANDVEKIFADSTKFVFLKSDGSVQVWPELEETPVNYQLLSGALNKDITNVAINSNAYAALRSDGTVVVWGNPDTGGDSSAVASELVKVKSIHGSGSAFVALKEDGSVVTWGDEINGGDSSSVKQLLKEVTNIYAKPRAFAAQTRLNGLVTWGARDGGGQNSDLSAHLKNVASVTASRDAMLFKKIDGSYFMMGREYAGDESRVLPELSKSSRLFNNHYAFAAIQDDGSVISWGNPNNGGDSSEVSTELNGVVDIASTQRAFSALTSTGEVISWGSTTSGGDNSSIKDKLFGVTKLTGFYRGFAAVNGAGDIVYWGGFGDSWTTEGTMFEGIGDSAAEIAVSSNSVYIVGQDGSLSSLSHFEGTFNLVNSPLMDVDGLFSQWSSSGFVADLGDGQAPRIVDSFTRATDLHLSKKKIVSSNFAYGSLDALGNVEDTPFYDESPFAEKWSLKTPLAGFKSIFANYYCLAAIRLDGSVLVWGDPRYGGDVTPVMDELTNVKTLIPYRLGFVAIKEDNSAVMWGVGPTPYKADIKPNRVSVTTSIE